MPDDSEFSLPYNYKNATKGPLSQPESSRSWLVRAPVRISFGGGGTDLAAYYAHFGGIVISTSITRYCIVIATPRVDGAIHLSSADYHCWETYPEGVVPPLQPPLALPKAAVALFMERGYLRTGLDLFLASEIPPGTGLGSSSAMAVALVHALGACTGQQFSRTEVAELACQLEIERLQAPIGKQDQYASALGGLNMLEFSASGVQVTPLALSPKTIATLNARLLLFASGQSRNSADILGQQRADTEKQPTTIETLHRLKELALQMRAALQEGDLDGFAQLLDRAWHEKKSLGKNVSSQAINQWYSVAREAGALGGKITGAGGGGFLLLYCHQEKQNALRTALAEYGLHELPFDLDFAGPQSSPLSRATTH